MAKTTALRNQQPVLSRFHDDYAAVLAIAVKYKRLPECEDPATTQVCAKLLIITQLRQADDIAFNALAAAQKLTPSGSTGPSVDQALLQAASAIAKLTAIAVERA